MTYYYNPKTGQYAKVLGVDDITGIAVVVINDKAVTMAWNEFIKEFKRMGVERWAVKNITTGYKNLKKEVRAMTHSCV